MFLSNSQSDALGELVNIAFGRAAAALSSMVRQRVELHPPEVNIYRLEELLGILKEQYQTDFASVHQIFSGSLTGDVLLLIENADARKLASLLRNDPAHHDPKYQLEPVTDSDLATLLEAGNILLNAFVGSFGNLLKVHISFTVPNLRIDTVEAILRSLSIDQAQINYALLIKTQFVLTKGNANGQVALIMGVQSLETLFETMQKVGLAV